jgi:phosphomannomutase
MSKYFGTDGFRGEAGITLTADHAYKVGRFFMSTTKRGKESLTGRKVGKKAEMRNE